VVVVTVTSDEAVVGVVLVVDEVSAEAQCTKKATTHVDKQRYNTT